jgi:hypothetical protein
LGKDTPDEKPYIVHADLLNQKHQGGDLRE